MPAQSNPAAIARFATAAGIWKTVQPYLEAMTVDARLVDVVDDLAEFLAPHAEKARKVAEKGGG